jgi:hypothetical protein
MANQIIKQPNGDYAIFSSVIDGFTHVDMTAEEIIELWSSQERARISESVYEIINQLQDGGKPYYQFTLNFDQAMKIHHEHGWSDPWK